MSDDEPTDEEIYGELARRFRLAFVSCHARVSYSTIERRFRDDETPPGPYWFELAKQVTEDLTVGADEVPAPADASHERGDN